MYENCWVEPSTGAAGLALPPLPARPIRTHSCRESAPAPDKAAAGLLESGAGLSKTHLLESPATSKTHLLDALFQGRKASQENLASSQGGLSSPLKLGLRSHTKSESIDSGSSASSYSIASECATLPGDLAASSVEVLNKIYTLTEP